MVIVALENDDFCKEATSKLNDPASEICTHIEREFLRTLEGGCTAPIGALAEIIEEKALLKGCLFSLDGKEKLEIEKAVAKTDYLHFGKECALQILKNGGSELMAQIKSQINK
ncbi:MAG: hypothetical protein CL524_07860 [Aequorivita sp.]|nr:hypothetical protein [Aequorivita sp.]